MKTKEIIEMARKLASPFCVSEGNDFRLKDVDLGDTLGFTKEEHKPEAKEALANGVMALAELQDKLYAQDRWAVLLIFQAMDGAALLRFFFFTSAHKKIATKQRQSRIGTRDHLLTTTCAQSAAGRREGKAKM